MEHLNYCRQMVKQFTQALAEGIGHREILQSAMIKAQASQKFQLPEGGRLYDDPLLRALDDAEPLTLPYKNIALEYPRQTYQVKEGQIRSSKAIIFAEQHENEIWAFPVSWFDAEKIWAPLAGFAIPRANFFCEGSRSDGRPAFKIIMEDASPAFAKQWLDNIKDEASALICFLNILQCSNVHIKRSEPKHTGKKVKAALPFDTYHILTVDVAKGEAGTGAATGSHRSPREHLRRGHIRRLQDGRRIWVNATIVAAGSGGVVTKDYVMRGPSK